MVAKKAVFLDKDGTLIPDIPFNVNIDLISLSPHTVEGLRLLQKSGYLIIVVTNQPGIAKGLYSDAEILAVEVELQQQLAKSGITLSGFYYCPHSPTIIRSLFRANCSCRKPKPGMLFRAAREHNIDLRSSWMIGDILNDIEAGNMAGCKTILIHNGNETEWEMTAERTPDYMAKNINEAVYYVLEINRLMNKYSQK